MDQIKIGAFIAEIRKGKKLTQKQLAEQLNISDKTISKWECGKGLPEVSLMLPLCEILEINVNELLAGEKLSMDNYHEKAEENMMNLLKEKAESKKRLIISFIIAITSAITLTIFVVLVGYTDLSTFTKILLIVYATVVVILGIGIAVVLDRDTGSFECPNCQTRFVPSMKAYVFGPHTLTKRYLKCPHCGESNYCIHRLTK